MAWLQDYGLVFDAVICVLLVTAIGYAAVLNRKLTLLRDAKRDMEKLFAEFAAATNEAQGGLQALKDGSGVAGEALAKNVNDACRLADEMAFLVKKGNEIADRLEVQIAASRKVAPPTAGAGPAAADLAAAPARGSESPKMDPVKPQAPQDPSAQAAARGIAKIAKRKLSGADSELMRALQGIR